MANVVKRTVGAVSTLLTGKKAYKPAPVQQVVPQEVQAPTPMPVADEQQIQQAKKRAVARQVGRRGRTSTILTGGGSGKLGG